jgi:hypothetical protein
MGFSTAKFPPECEFKQNKALFRFNLVQPDPSALSEMYCQIKRLGGVLQRPVEPARIIGNWVSPLGTQKAS